MIIWVGLGRNRQCNNSFTQEVILLIFRAPFNPGNPVVGYAVHQLGASALPEYGQILQHRAQSIGARRP